MGTRRAAVLAGVAVLLGLCAPCEALQVNFGNSYVPQPGGGLLQTFPSLAMGGSTMSVWNHVRVGLVDHFSLGVDAVVSAPLAAGGGVTSSNLYLDYRPNQLLPQLSVRLSPFVGLGTAATAGLTGYFDWRFNDRLTLYTSPGYVYASSAAAPHRAKLDMALDYRLLPWLSLDGELLSGAPHWNFGPNTALGLAPGATFYIGQATLQAALLFPMVKSIGAPALDALGGTVGLSYAW